MKKFKILQNEYLSRDIQAYYHQDYTRFHNTGNPDYLNEIKNTFGDNSVVKLRIAQNQLNNVLTGDLSSFKRDLTICIVPRSKAEVSYLDNQLLFKKVIQNLIGNLNFQDGSNYIIRHTDTKTTHLSHTLYGGVGSMPYCGITENTCHISSEVRGKNILLIDDIYTQYVNIDEDVIQALLDNGAQSIVFYAVGKALRKTTILA